MGPRETWACSVHCGGSRAPATFSAAEGSPGPTSRDPRTLHSQGEASAPPRARPPCTHPGAQQE